jgi:hypothetical protein
MPKLEEMLQDIRDHVTQYGGRFSENMPKFTLNQMLIAASDEVLKAKDETEAEDK